MQIAGKMPAPFGADQTFPLSSAYRPYFATPLPFFHTPSHFPMRIASFAQAQSWLRSRSEFYDVISIGRDVPRHTLCRRQLWLDFDDLTALPDPADGSRPDERAPQVKHVTQAVSFARNSDDEHLLIHCHAGLSRSPAIAWCILLDRLHDPAAATAKLFDLHPRAIPNHILIHCGLEILTGSTKEFAAVRAQMRRLSSHPQKLLFL